MACTKPVLVEDRFFSCGRCLSCRIQRRTIWTLRMLHHGEAYEHKTFVNLTYRDEDLMVRKGIPNLVPTDLRNFFKRLRINLKRDSLDDRISYYACGEYGEGTQRPHYHAIVFGVPLGSFKWRGDVMYATDDNVLAYSWGHGHVVLGTVTADSIRYVAQYIDKKLIGDTSYFSDRVNAFQVASTKIGLDWFRQNMVRCAYEASLLFRGKRFPIPRRYREELYKCFPDAAEGVDDRVRQSAITAEVDRILELCPHFGGRSYLELTEHEKDELSQRLYGRGAEIDADLKAGLLFRQNRLKRSKL